jgi:hypothetical protein
MRDYFRNAYVTISALDSFDSHHGILLPRELGSCIKLHSEQNLFLRKHLPEQQDVFHKAVLNHRAWVLQERLLSTRILHYSNDELLWECLTCSKRESSSMEEASNIDPSSVILSEGSDFKRI